MNSPENLLVYTEWSKLYPTLFKQRRNYNNLITSLKTEYNKRQGTNSMPSSELTVQNRHLMK